MYDIDIERNRKYYQEFLGHGYDFLRLPSDGSIKTIVVKIKMTNDDYLIAKTFEWYNK